MHLWRLSISNTQNHSQSLRACGPVNEQAKPSYCQTLGKGEKAKNPNLANLPVWQCGPLLRFIISCTQDGTGTLLGLGQPLLSSLLSCTLASAQAELPGLCIQLRMLLPTPDGHGQGLYTYCFQVRNRPLEVAQFSYS